MKIAFISTILHYPWGGADVLWTRTAERALAEKHQVFIAVAPAVAQHPRITALFRAGARIHLRSGHTQQRGNRDRFRQAVERFFCTPRSLTGALSSFQPDLVFLCQGGSFDFLVEDGLLRWLAATRCACVPICQANDARTTLSLAQQASARSFFSRTAHVVFVSTHNRDLASRQIDGPVQRAIVVPNPVERIAEEVPWPGSATPRLAVVARLESDPKGLDVMLEALARMDRNSDWEVSVFGRGPDEGALRAEAERRRLAHRVVFRGYESDLARLWSSHHLLLLPSRTEGCALALLEALACGRPVLTTETGGARDWIAPGTNGWICTPDDAAALVDTLRSALNDFHRWSNYGRASRQIFRERYIIEPDQQLLSLASAVPVTESS